MTPMSACVCTVYIYIYTYMYIYIYDRKLFRPGASRMLLSPAIEAVVVAWALAFRIPDGCVSGFRLR